MNETPRHEVLGPPVARGSVEGWSPRVRRYLWADEAPRPDPSEQGVSEPPLAQRSPDGGVRSSS
jgi:hypothetical protein